METIKATALIVSDDNHSESWEHARVLKELLGKKEIEVGDPFFDLNEKKYLIKFEVQDLLFHLNEKELLDKMEALKKDDIEVMLVFFYGKGFGVFIDDGEKLSCRELFKNIDSENWPSMLLN